MDSGWLKTGITGVGILAVALFSIAMPGRAAVGVVLPLLIVADCFAVLYYRRHADWKHLWRLFPWAALGIMLGAAAMGHITDHQVGRLIGWLLIVLTAIQAAQKSAMGRVKDAGSEGDASEVGILARGGVVTALLGLLANGFCTAHRLRSAAGAVNDPLPALRPTAPQNAVCWNGRMVLLLPQCIQDTVQRPCWFDNSSNNENRPTVGCICSDRGFVGKSHLKAYRSEVVRGAGNAGNGCGRVTTGVLVTINRFGYSQPLQPKLCGDYR